MVSSLIARWSDKPLNSRSRVNTVGSYKGKHQTLIHIHTFGAKHVKNRYLSAKNVSKTPENWGFMGSNKNISRTMLPIAVKLSENVADK